MCLIAYAVLVTAISKYAASSSIFTTAISLVQDSEKVTSDRSICKTWIFVFEADSNKCSDDTLEYFRNDNLQLHDWRPRVLFDLKDSVQYRDLNLDREYTSQDIFNSTYFGVSRHAPNCQVVFILASRTESFIGISKYLISERFFRPHKDYALFLAESYNEEVSDFANSAFADDIRFKYSIVQNNSTTEISDFCSKHHTGKWTLFQRNCNAVINGKHIRVSAVLGTPYVRFQNNKDGSLQSGAGIQFQLVDEASKKFNYTYQIIPSDSRGSSGFKKDGKWYGAMGDVFLRRAEIALAAGITPQRDTVTDNGVPFEWNPRIFLVRTPHLRTNWKAIFWPFDKLVWTLILSLAVVYVPAYFLSLRYYRYYETHPLTKNSNLDEVVGSVIGIILEQSRKGQRWIGLRIRSLILLWMIFCLVMGAGYRSRLITFLTFIIPDRIPESHQELLDEGFTLFFRFYGGVAYHYATTSNDSVAKAVVDRSILINSSQECIILATLTENSACLDWRTHGSYAVYTNATHHVRQTSEMIVKSKDIVQTILMAWSYRKRSPLTDIFDGYILKTYSSGLFNFWQAADWTASKAEGARWMNNAKHSSVTTRILAFFNDFSLSPKPLELSSFLGIFVLWGILLLISAVIWLIEFLKFKCIDARSLVKTISKG